MVCEGLSGDGWVFLFHRISRDLELASAVSWANGFMEGCFHFSLFSTDLVCIKGFLQEYFNSRMYFLFIVLRPHAIPEVVEGVLSALLIQC